MPDVTTELKNNGWGVDVSSDGDVRITSATLKNNGSTVGGGSFSWASVPASASAAGTAGDIAYDANYIYLCVATNTWKRAPIATW